MVHTLYHIVSTYFPLKNTICRYVGVGMWVNFPWKIKSFLLYHKIKHFLENPTNE